MSNKIEGHSYDGIEELDNALPNWWLNGFYLTILFSAIYFVYYAMGDGPSLKKEYERDQQAHQYLAAVEKSKAPAANEDDLRALLKDPAKLALGKEAFKSKCVSCHGEQGQGGIGPNLTDDYWIHGGKMAQILTTITQGVADKGMPPWGGVLKQDELFAVTAYVKSLRGTHPPHPKAPQGEFEKE